MATVINNPGTTDTNSGSVLGIVLALVVAGAVLLALVYGLPATNVEQGGGVPIPDKVNIDVNTPPVTNGPAPTAPQSN